MITIDKDIPDMEAAVLLMKTMGAKFQKATATAFYLYVPKNCELQKTPVRMAQCGRIFNEVLGCKLLIKKEK